MISKLPGFTLNILSPIKMQQCLFLRSCFVVFEISDVQSHGEPNEDIQRHGCLQHREKWKANLHGFITELIELILSKNSE